MTSTERTKEIRKALKAEGYNTKEVSVRREHLGYDDYITVTIRKPDIKSAEINEIVKPFEQIHRNEWDGDKIMAGCNAFVNVVYAEDFAGETAENKMNEAAEFWSKSDKDNSFYIRPGVRLCSSAFKFVKRDGSINGKVMSSIEELADWLARYDYAH